MNSKLTFRSRAFDVLKPLLVLREEELRQLPNYDPVGSREVPQMPTGMEKAEEKEVHLLDAISKGLQIPIPGVETISDEEYHHLYPATSIRPKNYIHRHFFSTDSLPNYDADSEDEEFLKSQIDIDISTFERMIETFEKELDQNVITLEEAKLWFPEEGFATIAVYEYWLNKRLRSKGPLMPSIPHEARHNVDQSYTAFRKRIDKRITRRNRKNDEMSYFKMVKLQDNLAKVLNLLKLVKEREVAKREMVRLVVQIYEKRYSLGDFNSQIYSKVLDESNDCSNSYTKPSLRKLKKNKLGEKKKKSQLEENEAQDDENNPFIFKRKAGCTYLEPAKDFWGTRQKTPMLQTTVFTEAGPRRIFARRRIGRGGRVILDRPARSHDEVEENYPVLRELDSSTDIVLSGHLTFELENLDDGEIFVSSIDTDNFQTTRETLQVIHCRGKVGFTEHLSDIR